VSSLDELVELNEKLLTCQEFAVDLEHHSYRSFLGLTCLMQISTRTEDFIVDTLELRSDMYILNESLTDPAIVKVFHGADSDIEWLQKDFGLYVVNMFDTHQAARLLNLGRHSLDHLLKLYCSVDSNKQYQLADWRIRFVLDKDVWMAAGSGVLLSLSATHSHVRAVTVVEPWLDWPWCLLPLVAAAEAQPEVLG